MQIGTVVTENSMKGSQKIKNVAKVLDNRTEVHF